MSDTPPSVLQWLRLSNRDVSDIWIGCLVTISASTFLALHLSVDPYNPPQTTGWLRKWWLSRFNRELRRELLWTIVMVIAPELMVGFSFGDWRAASVGLHMFRRFGKGPVQGWSKVHASFANMGGLRFKMKTDSPEDTPFPPIDDNVLVDMFNNTGLHITTFKLLRRLVGNYVTALVLWLRHILDPFVTHLTNTWNRIMSLGRRQVPTAPPTVSIQLSNLNIQPGTGQQTHNQTAPTQAEGSASQSDRSRAAAEERARDLVPGELTLYLNATQIVVAQYLNILDDGPLLSEETIEDKSKTNPLSKGIAIISLFWFILGIFIQLFQGEGLTQLELSTFTYAVCAAIAYCFYWTKPQAVEVPIEHSVVDSNTVRSVTNRDIGILKYFSGSPFLLRNFTPRYYPNNRDVNPEEPNTTDASLTVFAIVKYDNQGILFYDSDFAGVAMGMVFGAIYCLGWNNDFPSQWERLAWRVSSLTITASLVPYSVVNLICTVKFGNLSGVRARMTHPVHILSLALLGSIYVACRLYMLFEMIRALIS
ncbi:hypothetical protein F5Y11DRAFT_231570 [Daldinia sp. FL1419]|nr:hypothetical protein F5Y11DRAFT_231570 [Daldinia sp. FL1419]